MRIICVPKNGIQEKRSLSITGWDTKNDGETKFFNYVTR